MSNREPEGRFSDLPPAPAASDRPVFCMRVRAEPRVDPIRALRWLLETMLRQYGLRCVSIEEEKQP